EVLLPGEALEARGEVRGGERAGRDDGRAVRVDDRELARDTPDAGAGEAALDRRGEGVPVDAQILSGWDARAIGRLQHERSELAELLLQETGGDLGDRGLERVRADELGGARGAVRRRRLLRTHLQQVDRDPAMGELPRRLRPRETRADDENGFAHPFYPNGRSAPRARRASGRTGPADPSGPASGPCRSRTFRRCRDAPTRCPARPRHRGTPRP